jgi:Rps23 Pro-64 3,4-dihydroxylase Tpa1-like proline 4-hydroxylase
MSNDGPPVRLARNLDRRGIAQVYSRASRVHLVPILAQDCAEYLLREFSSSIPWQLHLNSGPRSINLEEDQFEALPAEDQQKILSSVHASAAEGFQFLYNRFPVSDLYEQNEHRSLYVMRVFKFLNSPEFLDCMREVTGAANITFADAQATRYRPGHFLNAHDDSLGKDRVVAYVLNLTPAWKADWGGVLQFIDQDGHVAEGYTPAFNALNIFRIPQFHGVSYVTPFARSPRYSISGWLRRGPRPESLVPSGG